MKKLVVAIVVGALAWAVRAGDGDSYLYWMVEQDAGSGYAFDYAQLKAFDGAGNSGYLTLYDFNETTQQFAPSGSTMVEPDVVGGKSLADACWSKLDDSWSSFVVELWKDGNPTASYESNVFLRENVGYAIRSTQLDENSPMTATSFHAIPEPTSGLLVLIGCSLLALKRRKA